MHTLLKYKFIIGLQLALGESEDSDDNDGLRCDKNKLIDKLDVMKIENERLKKELTNHRKTNGIHESECFFYHF